MCEHCFRLFDEALAKRLQILRAHAALAQHALHAGIDKADYYRSDLDIWLESGRVGK